MPSLYTMTIVTLSMVSAGTEGEFVFQAQDDVINVPEDANATTFSVLTNDTVGASVVQVNSGDIRSEAGTLQHVQNGEFTYIPRPNFDGTAAFTYFIAGDGFGTTEVEADGAAAAGGFGSTLAVHGNTLLVGSSGAAVVEEGEGEGETTVATGLVMVFVRVDGVWTEQAELIPPELGEGAEFGASAALENDTAVIGAPGQDSGLRLRAFGHRVELGSNSYARGFDRCLVRRGRSPSG